MSRRALRVAVIGQGFMGRAHGFGWARAAALEGSRLTPELAVLCGRDRAVLAGAYRFTEGGRPSTRHLVVVEDHDSSLLQKIWQGRAGE